ncbi:MULTISPECIES: DUF3850 domain-containing protein [unclassified Serratia (in: enterobacteria)]|uniref:DUF3850 domain-containing protein n=1 Tax=unclassified Serratia (in: enterobacteria) TaxID=2647522 RepID=UPI0030764766
MKTHHLKIQPEYFAAVVSGDKKAEIRINDRDYEVGDMLRLNEYGQRPALNGLMGFSGEFIWARVTHITDLSKWLPGYVMLSIERGPFKS